MRGHGPFVRLTLLAAAATLALAAAGGPAPAAVYTPAPADLAVSVTSFPEPARALDGRVTDRVVVKNNGPNSAPGVTVVDEVAPPLGLIVPTNIHATPPADLAAGDSMTVEFTVVSSRSGTYSRTVRATTTAVPDPDPGNNSAAAVTTFDCALCVTTSTSPSPAVAFAPLTYTVTVANTLASRLDSVRLTDTLPADFVPGPVPGGCTLAGQRATCDLGDLDAGASRRVSFPGTPQATGPLANAADATALVPDDPSWPISDGSRSIVVVQPPTADLALTQTSQASAGIEGSFSVTATVQNNGPGTAASPIVTETFPDELTFGGLPSECTPSAPNAFHCELGTLPPGARDSVSFDVVPRATGRFSVRGEVGAAAVVDPEPANNVALTDTTIDCGGRRSDVLLCVLKRGAPDPVGVGQPLTYTFTIDSVLSPGREAFLVDKLPDAVEFVSSSLPNCQVDGSVLACSLGTLEPRTTRTAAVVVRPRAPGLLVNSAVVRAPGGGSHTSFFWITSRPAIELTRVVPAADVSIVKTAPAEANVGDTIPYTLAVRNAGPSAAEGVSVTDRLPAGLEFVSAAPNQGSCAGTSTVTCSLGALAAGAEATITIRARALEAGTISNSTSLTSATFDPNAANNESTARTRATSADVSVAIDDSPDPVSVGKELTYTVTVRNSGASSARNVTVTDPIPAEAIPVSATASRGSCSVGPTVTCALGDLVAGDRAFVTVLVRPGAAGTLRNTVSVSNATHDPVASNDTAAAETRVLSADLSLAMRATPRPVDVGARLTYTLDVSNAGPTEARDVHVRDALPRELELLSTSSSRGTCSTGEADVECSLGDLAQGDTATIRIVAVPVRAGTILNTATVAGSDLDPREANNHAAVRAVVTSADVAVTMRAAAARPRVGIPLTYTLNIRNLGPSRAHGVHVTDELPAGAELASVRTGAGACRAGTRVVCDIRALAPGDAAAVQVTVRPRTAGRLTNATQVSAAEFDPDLGNNRARVTTGAGRLPRLLLAPGLGSGGTVTSVIGLDFPPHALVTLRWRPGVGAATVRTDGDGGFQARMLVMPHDTLGRRLLVAGVAAPEGEPLAASASFLVVPGRLQPQDFLERG